MASLAICLQPFDKNDVALDRQGHKKEGDIRLWSKPSRSKGLLWVPLTFVKKKKKRNWIFFFFFWGGGWIGASLNSKRWIFFFSPYSHEFIENHETIKVRLVWYETFVAYIIFMQSHLKPSNLSHSSALTTANTFTGTKSEKKKRVVCCWSIQPFYSDPLERSCHYCHWSPQYSERDPSDFHPGTLTEKDAYRDSPSREWPKALKD